MKKVSTLSIIIVAILVMNLVAYLFPQVTKPKDLYTQYLPATRVLLRGKNPYSIEGFFNPPWVLLLFLPLAWMPDTLAASIYFCVSLIAWLFIAYKSKLRGWGAIAFLLSPPVVYSMAMGGIDWLPIIGLFVKHPWKWLFLITKPQMTAGYFIAAIKDKRLAYGAVVILLALCILLNNVGEDQHFYANIAIRPRIWALSIGFFLCYLLIERDKCLAPWIGPIISPYASTGSWAGIYLSISQRHGIVWPVILLGWLLLIL